MSNSDGNYIVNVGTVPGLIKFAGFIYKTYPGYSSEILDDSNNRICGCSDTSNYFIYKENIFGVANYRCANSCPQGHYYYFNMFKSFLYTEFKDNKFPLNASDQIIHL